MLATFINHGLML